MASDTSRKLKVGLQIPRNALALLMVAQVVVVAPQIAQLPIWIVAACLLCGIWRTGVYQGRWDFPRVWVKALLVVGGSVGVALAAGDAFSLEKFVSLLVLAFAFKLVEMKTRRDAYVVIFLCYFLIGTQFLFDQSILLTLYELVAVIVVTGAMIALNQMHSDVRPFVTARVATTLVLQALPLTVVLFLFFPRVAPLWSVPLPGSGITGLSDTVAPGQIAQLTQSDALAFRAQFEGPAPAYRDLYWRALVYTEYDDGTWKVGNPFKDVKEDLRAGPNVGAGTGSASAYEVLLQPTAQDWWVALDVPIRFDSRAQLQPDYTLKARDPVLSVQRYQITSATEAQFGQRDIDLVLEHNLQLPPDENPRLRAYAAGLAARYQQPEAIARALLEAIRTEAFHYTLSPPLLEGDNTIDQFWFETRRGFCAHYASAFVFAMRSVGVPARMVGGYMGGEVNPLSGHLMVRQYDAHGWAEIWLAEHGWVRFDPTAAVAPNRIEQGLASALSQAERASLAVLTNARLDASSLVGQMLFFFDSLEHRWNLFVIGYDNQVQSRLLKEWLGNLSPARIGIAMLILGGLCLAFVAALLFLRARPRKQHPVLKLLARFSAIAARTGHGRENHESPGAYLRRLGELAGWSKPQQDALATAVTQATYDPEHQATQKELRDLRSQLRTLQFRLVLNR